MTSHRDFKRLVRRRMQKTGESYTTARAQLVRSRRPRAQLAPPSPLPAAPAPLAPPSPADYAKLAGISDAAVKAKTGCTWERWVLALDYHKAYEWPHRRIAEFVSEKYQVRDWWCQTVTVGYERIRGLRVKGQRRGGGFEATRSKVFPVPMARLFRAFRDKRTRARWLDGVDLVVRTATKDRSMRVTWPDQTSVDLWFTAKGSSRAQVQVQHGKLPDQEAAARMKAYWGERLAALGALLAPAP
jgi:uncharacterized protein YndB with AHSA1/START domain